MINRSESLSLPIDLDDEQATPVTQPLEPVALPSRSTPTNRAPGDRFRLQAKFFFLTWPQCDTEPSTVLERLMALPTHDYSVVAREKHQDGSNHLHCFLALTKPNRKTGYEWLDRLADSHGNYQAARDNAKVVRYVVKDSNFVASPSFDPAAYLELASQKKSRVSATPSGQSKASTFAALIRDENATIDQIDDLDPGYVMSNKRKLEEYSAWQKVKRAALAKLPWPSVDLDSYPNADATFKIAKWIAENIKQPREFKQKQLYVWSEAPDVGKTHLTRELAKYLTVYPPPRSQYWDGYESGRYDLVVFDEFRADRTLQDLNEFLQGSEITLNVKGSTVVKSDNPPIIILANSPPDRIFSKKKDSPQFKAFLARLTVVRVPDNHKIDVFHQL